MPHKCIHCGIIYPDAAPELLKGCPCGSHFFMFFKQQDIDKVEEVVDLTKQEKEEMEDDVREIIGSVDNSMPVILDFESIRVKKPGKFEIDLSSLFKRKPLVYKLEDGKYLIDIASTFQFEKSAKAEKKKEKD